MLKLRKCSGKHVFEFEYLAFAVMNLTNDTGMTGKLFRGRKNKDLQLNCSENMVIVPY